MSGLDPRGRCDRANPCGSAECARCSPLEECGLCGAYHRPDFDGDCRDDAERFDSPDAFEAVPARIEFIEPGRPLTRVQNLAGAASALGLATILLEAAECDIEACDAHVLLMAVEAQIEQDR